MRNAERKTRNPITDGLVKSPVFVVLNPSLVVILNEWND
jgi:hypothetical protein